jgi:hypothetical protein
MRERNYKITTQSSSPVLVGVKVGIAEASMTLEDVKAVHPHRLPSTAPS